MSTLLRYVKRFYYTKPSVFKLIKLLSVDNTKELNNLGIFLVQAEKLRYTTAVLLHVYVIHFHMQLFIELSQCSCNFPIYCYCLQ